MRDPDIIPNESNANPMNNKSIKTNIINNTLLVSIEPIVMNAVKIKYPRNANPNCLDCSLS